MKPYGMSRLASQKKFGETEIKNEIKRILEL